MVDQSLIDSVTKVVKRILKNGYDHQQIAIDILMESLTNGHESPTKDFIRHRCVDCIRRNSSERKALRRYKKFHHKEYPHDTTEDEDHVERLVSVLSPEERKVVWYRFYQDLHPKEIAKRVRLPLQRVHKLLATAAAKMRLASTTDLGST